jgi:hypothetical protein
MTTCSSKKTAARPKRRRQGVDFEVTTQATRVDKRNARMIFDGMRSDYLRDLRDVINGVLEDRNDANARADDRAEGSKVVDRRS